VGLRAHIAVRGISSGNHSQQIIICWGNILRGEVVACSNKGAVEEHGLRLYKNCYVGLKQKNPNEKTRCDDWVILIETH